MIHTYLDLSTGHLTDATRMLLDDCADHQRAPNSGVGIDGWPAMTVAAYDHGFFVTVPDDMTNEQMDALPSDLEEVLSHARDQGATLVRFDSDGDALHALPFYEET